MSKLLPNPDFLEWLLHSIAKAKSGIVLVNYLATLRDSAGRGASTTRRKRRRAGPVARIASELAKAKGRGVDITVILEGSKFRENYCFYRVLKDAGVDVWLDTSVTFIHQKAVLVDGRILCVGSHNLSASALTSHEELALVTRDRAAIRRFRRHLSSITAQRRAIGGVSREGVAFPASVIAPTDVIEGGGPFVRIKRARASNAYLLYLLLCRVDRGKPCVIEIDASEWVRVLGLSKSVASDRVRIFELLDFLSGRLKLVRFDRNKETVKRKSVKRSVHRILLPDVFWDHGWHKRLSVEAIHLYFAGEYERQVSPNAPWWRRKRDEIAKRYGFSKHLVNRAQMELRRAGLLEVLFETASSTYKRYIRYMNYFRQDPFYDYDARMAKIEGLTKQFSGRTFAAAKKIAHELGEDSDAEKIDALCGHIAKTGTRRAASVLREISGLSPNSTRRTFAYAEELFGK